MNKFIISGNVTHNPKKIVYNAAKNLSMVKLGVAVHDRDSTTFFDCKIFEPTLVEQVATYVTQGKSVELSGHMEKYKDNWDFVATEVIFGAGKKSEEVSGANDNF